VSLTSQSAMAGLSRPGFDTLQIENLRYGRLKVCATHARARRRLPSALASRTRAGGAYPAHLLRLANKVRRLGRKAGDQYMAFCRIESSDGFPAARTCTDTGRCPQGLTSPA